MTKIEKYKCDGCKKEFEFLDQDIYEGLFPVGHGFENREEGKGKHIKFTYGRRHFCNECSDRIYQFIYGVLIKGEKEERKQNT